MIADRRGRNFYEAAIEGPSRLLPCGPVLTSMCISPSCERLSLNATDRKDFYHQMGVTEQRARRNILVPSLPAFELAKTSAFAALCSASAGPQHRKSARDHLGLVEPDALHHAKQGSPALDSYLFAGFGAVMQGDALGVEFACSAHANLLASGGLLDRSSRILGAHPFPVSGEEGLLEGLVIDDYYTTPSLVSKPPRSTRTPGFVRRLQVPVSGKGGLQEGGAPWVGGKRRR